MDAAQFDRFTTRLTSQLSRRRSLSLLGVIGLGGLIVDDAAAGKKKMKKVTLCLNRQTVKVKKKKKRSLLRQGATSGPCPPCTPTTCAAQSRACGPLADGCGRTLTCGTCNTDDDPTCTGGTCGPCFLACAPSCLLCANHTNGATTCAQLVSILECTPCAKDADCPQARPTCLRSSTTRGANDTTTFSVNCGTMSPGICAAITPC